MEKRPQLFDVCIVCALYKEAEAVLREFSARCKVSFGKEFSGADLYEYRYTTIQNNRGEPLTVLVTWLADNGPVRTGLHLKPFLQEFHPRLAAMTGICAGYKEKDVRLGDLIVAEYAYHYEVGKDTIGKDGQKKHEIQTITYGVTSQILQYARSFQDWREPVARLKRPKVRQEKIKGSEPLKERPPTCYIAPIASGMAVKEDEPFPWLREYINRKTLALDMESAAFYLTLQEVSSLGIHSLVVKGVSDYADGSKNDEYHKYAERASAIYLLYFIREYVTNTTMPRRSSPPSSSRAGPSPVWNIPYAPNPFFTGRDQELEQLHTQLWQSNTAVIGQTRAISGLGGVGKTAIAIEYAHLHLQDYQAVLWVRADSIEALNASYSEIATLLKLQGKDAQEQEIVLQAVKTWLSTSQGWLLILDNADEPEILRSFLPSRMKGHLLITTRAADVSYLGFGHALTIETFTSEKGMKFLLHRAGLLATNTCQEDALSQNYDVAQQITRELGNLPLALDQAGAYIASNSISLTEYLYIYKQRRAQILKERHNDDYPASVATTWNISFKRVEAKNPGAADLLRLCAYLSPDAIPEEIFTKGAGKLGPVLDHVAVDAYKFNQAIVALRTNSLLTRYPRTHTLSVHRLVQAVLRDNMTARAQKRWKQRAVQVVSAASPDVEDVEQWDACAQWVPHVLVCATWIKDEHLDNEENASLLNKAGYYLDDRARYSEAEPLYQLALMIRGQVLGATHHETTSSLINLGLLYRNQEKYAEAESLLTYAWEICGQWLTSKHLDIARVDQAALTLNNLALLYADQEKYAEAEPLYVRVLAICKQRLGAEHLTTARILNNLGALYVQQKKYAEAEPLLKGALAIREQVRLQHPDTAQTLNNLATLYEKQEKYTEAESLLQHSLTIYKQTLGPEHPTTKGRIEKYMLLLQKMEGNAEREDKKES